MPSLLNNSVGLQGTTGTNTYFISLSGAQPALGRTPTTGTGYTLVSTGSNGLLTFSSTLGGVFFNNGIIQSQTSGTNLTIQSTGTGIVNITGTVYISASSILSQYADFQNLTITNLTVIGNSVFSSTTSTTVFDTGVLVSGNFTATGHTVTIYPSNSGTIDNTVIGSMFPASGSFTNLTIQNEFVSNNFTATTGYIGTLINSTLTSNEASISTATIDSSLTVYGQTSIEPNNANVTISPGGTGKLYINSGGVGYLDKLIIGLNTPESGFFTTLTVDDLVLNQTLNLSTATFITLDATNLNVSGQTDLNNLSVTGTTTVTTLISTGTISAYQLFDNGNRVLTNINFANGPGITGTSTIVGTTATLHLTNTGVVSIIAGTDTSISTSTGNVTLWNTSTLETVTSRGSTTDQIIYITNGSASVTTNSGALQVAGGIGVGNNVNIQGNVYSAGGSSYYNNLLYTPAVTISVSPPVGPRIGDFWIDPSAGIEYQYVPNGTSTIWIQFIGF